MCPRGAQSCTAPAGSPLLGWEQERGPSFPQLPACPPLAHGELCCSADLGESAWRAGGRGLIQQPCAPRVGQSSRIPSARCFHWAPAESWKCVSNDGGNGAEVVG